MVTRTTISDEGYRLAARLARLAGEAAEACADPVAMLKYLAESSDQELRNMPTLTLTDLAGAAVVLAYLATVESAHGRSRPTFVEHVLCPARTFLEAVPDPTDPPPAEPTPRPDATVLQFDRARRDVEPCV